jgi:hypothetical protein
MPKNYINIQKCIVFQMLDLLLFSDKERGLQTARSASLPSKALKPVKSTPCTVYLPGRRAILVMLL